MRDVTDAERLHLIESACKLGFERAKREQWFCERDGRPEDSVHWAARAMEHAHILRTGYGIICKWDARKKQASYSFDGKEAGA